MLSLSRLADIVKATARGPWARQRQASAYQRFYEGTATKQDADLIITDIAVYVARFRSAGPDEELERLKYWEGRRSVYDYLMRFRSMSENQWKDLEEAVAQETLTTETEGDI